MISGYRKTDIGVIPHDWDIQSLKEFSRVETGSTPPTSEVDNYGEEFLFVSPADMGLTKYIAKSEKKLSKKGFSISRKSPKGSILFVCIGSTIGKCGIASKELAFNQQINAVLPSHTFSGDYLYYALSAAAARIKFLAGEQAVPLVNKTQFLETRICLPLLHEQNVIASALSDVDEFLASIGGLIVKKRNLKKAAMQQLLTGQARLPGYEGEWLDKHLGGVATFHKGKGLPKSELTEYGSEPCIHYGELFTRYAESIDKVMSRTDVSGAAFRSVANDVLMPTSDVTPRGLAKASCIKESGVILGGDILVIRSDIQLIFGTFLSYLIRFSEDQVLQLVTGSTVFHLYGSDMKKFKFSMPPLAEQIAIANVLSDMDSEITKLMMRRDKISVLKQGLMQELLTGKTRLI